MTHSIWSTRMFSILWQSSYKGKHSSFIPVRSRAILLSIIYQQVFCPTSPQSSSRFKLGAYSKQCPWLWPICNQIYQSSPRWPPENRQQSPGKSLLTSKCSFVMRTSLIVSKTHFSEMGQRNHVCIQTRRFGAHSEPVFRSTSKSEIILQENSVE